MLWWEVVHVVVRVHEAEQRLLRGELRSIAESAGAGDRSCNPGPRTTPVSGSKKEEKRWVSLSSFSKRASSKRAQCAAWTRIESRPDDGGVCAIANACTHLGGPLDEGERDGNVVACPWHGSRFDPCSGEVLRGPATEPQRRFESRLREGKIEVRLP